MLSLLYADVSGVCLFWCLSSDDRRLRSSVTSVFSKFSVIKVKVVVSSYDEGYFIEGYFVGYVKACAWWKNGNEVWRKSTVCVSFRRDADGARSCLSSFTGISFASGTLP